MEFSARISAGRLVLDNPPAFKAWVATQRDGLHIRIKITRRLRSNQQNAYYWGVVIPAIAGHTGHGQEELHEILKSMFLGREVKDVAGREVVCTRSTTALDTKQFSEYVETVAAWAATDLGISIPPPESAP